MLASASVRAAAQVRSQLDLGGASIEVGGEEERYLRVLQIAGKAPLTPWTVQPFSPTQTAALRKLGPNPWESRYDSTSREHAASVLRPKARVIGNSTFPFQDGPGPTWAGRGLTGEVEGGIAARWTVVHFQLAPTAFLAQNLSFALAPNGRTGDQRFGDARFPLQIDAPQRFGSKAYGRIDPGESSLSADALGLFVGLSSAAQRWGPDREFPLVLGPNAGGFPEAFAGTSKPLDLWLFRVHGRVVYGELGQSAIAAPVLGERRRFGSGLVGTILPRGVPGLELGGSRFIHEEWPAGGLTLHSFTRPFSAAGNLLGSSSADNPRTENQVASFFARWALPSAKAEFYGELYREDFFGKFHRAPGSLIEKPDDYASFALGFQRVFVSNEHHIRLVRGELVNGEISHQERDARGFTIPLPPYIHSVVTQGHTVNGLILGSPDAYGGSGWRLGVDDYTSSGRRSFTFERSLRFDWLPGTATGTSLVHPDVIYDVRAEMLRFAGRRDIGITLIPAVDLNRNLVAKHDVLNLTAAVTVRGW
ncbi:MAG TPA: hypothetical protein VHB25_14430 [Gemmatimonadaceae bacterium]|nr:hypothetical protein [Gemmatimonadaceae bacterium]